MLNGHSKSKNVPKICILLNMTFPSHYKIAHIHTTEHQLTSIFTLLGNQKQPRVIPTHILAENLFIAIICTFNGLLNIGVFYHAGIASI